MIQTINGNILIRPAQNNKTVMDENKKIGTNATSIFSLFNMNIPKPIKDRNNKLKFINQSIMFIPLVLLHFSVYL